MRYASGEVILYNPFGVCKIADVREQSFGDMAGEYYVLKPLYREESTIYVPVGNEQLTHKLRSLLSPDEAQTLLRETPPPDIVWIEDSRERSDTYMHRISAGDRPAAIGIIRLLTDHKAEVARLGHKFYASDEKVLSAACRMIGEELAYVLDLPQQDVLDRLLA